MRATYRMIGCSLCLAFAGSAAAASLDNHSLDSVSHATANRAAHDSDSSGADAADLSHDASTVNAGGGPSGTSRNGNDHSGGTSSAPVPNPKPQLGWQSLLPGSIQ
ncbi:MAG: hypothetical protein ABI386_10330 [Rhodanobacter sp.]